MFKFKIKDLVLFCTNTSCLNKFQLNSVRGDYRKYSHYRKETDTLPPINSSKPGHKDNQRPGQDRTKEAVLKQETETPSGESQRNEQEHELPLVPKRLSVSSSKHDKENLCNPQSSTGREECLPSLVNGKDTITSGEKVNIDKDRQDIKDKKRNLSLNEAELNVTNTKVCVSVAKRRRNSDAKFLNSPQRVSFRHKEISIQEKQSIISHREPTVKKVQEPKAKVKEKPEKPEVIYCELTQENVELFEKQTRGGAAESYLLEKVAEERVSNWVKDIMLHLPMGRHSSDTDVMSP